MSFLKTDKMAARKDKHVGWITFNNPARHNAVSLEMWQGLADIAHEFARDDDIRVVVVHGAGEKAFVSGADISEFAEQRDSAEATQRYDAVAQEGMQALKNLNKPTLAMIQGYCIGGGVGVALNCDIRIAADHSRFAVPAAKLGLGYEFDGVRKLVDVVGPSFAQEIFFTARQFSAPEALAMGLINRMVPQEDLLAYVTQYADTIAANAPMTVASIKTIVGEIVKDPSLRNVALCDQLVAQCFNSVDFTEGRTAFMEKRKPVFTGR
ncbi:enoyl-CoA hydratase [Limnohabitans sp. WS1]|uniref:enoyl-CoA hydratase n=1 Tax=Limnohabitans sp. WS1 TaxID=1100726 RepID=UPI000D39D3E1|nr:enoyl-CoA hydratase [Limnohabitans sp. WS1]PUE17880.1 enoyl-CoA hydratase [Limnohabitans sp. WS1]